MRVLDIVGSGYCKTFYIHVMNYLLGIASSQIVCCWYDGVCAISGIYLLFYLLAIVSFQREFMTHPHVHHTSTYSHNSWRHRTQ
jgi:hypothetical protein